MWPHPGCLLHLHLFFPSSFLVHAGSRWRGLLDIIQHNKNYPKQSQKWAPQITSCAGGSASLR